MRLDRVLWADCQLSSICCIWLAGELGTGNWELGAGHPQAKSFLAPKPPETKTESIPNETDKRQPQEVGGKCGWLAAKLTGTWVRIRGNCKLLSTTTPPFRNPPPKPLLSLDLFRLQSAQKCRQRLIPQAYPPLFLSFGLVLVCHFFFGFAP